MPREQLKRWETAIANSLCERPDAEGHQHLMVPHALAALDQPEIADDAIRPAAHAGKLCILKMIAHARQHPRSMHRPAIPSILTEAEST